MSQPELSAAPRRRVPLAALLPLGGFLVLVGFFGISLFQGHDPSALPSVMIDKPAPEFDLPALLPDKPSLARADLGGKPVIVNFFASWCQPCRIEHPIWAGLAAANDVPIYGIDFEDKPEDAQRFLAQLGDPYARIGTDRSGRTGIDFGVYGVPETYLIDAAGRIRFRYAGPVTPEVLQREILPRLEALRR
jgi:cytochrome c biogenesis protein CcmG/thiol:disulfide interchange protein DsbE